MSNELNSTLLFCNSIILILSKPKINLSFELFLNATYIVCPEKEEISIVNKKINTTQDYIIGIQNINNVGLHLIYSQFRTLEGIGILKLILEENGFFEFKIQKTGAGG